MKNGKTDGRSPMIIRAYLWPMAQVKLKIAIRRDGKSPDLKVNDKQLQTDNLVYIFIDIILSVNASKYGMTIIELTSFPNYKVYSREIIQKGSKGEKQFLHVTHRLDLKYMYTENHKYI